MKDEGGGARGAAGEWLARQRGAVTPVEYELLARAQATLLANVGDPNDFLDGESCGGRKRDEAGKPLPWHPLRGIYPSPYKYRGVWNWDGAFHAIAVARWNVQLAREGRPAIALPVDAARSAGCWLVGRRTPCQPLRQFGVRRYDAAPVGKRACAQTR